MEQLTLRLEERDRDRAAEIRASLTRLLVQPSAQLEPADEAQPDQERERLVLP